MAEITILALDASSTNIGYCVSHSPETYLRSGVYSPRGNAEARFRKIVFWIVKALSTYKPTIVAIEEPAGDHGNRKTDRLLSRIVGAIEAVAVLRGVERVVRVYPATVKATGFHKGATDTVAAMVQGWTRTATRPVVGEDEADAIGVWLATEAMLSGERIARHAG
jgi:Holliday junction resolvasome RuvABC endonuclease subunit